MFGDKKSTCGVIGLGIIGSQVALNLRSARVHVYVWNRTPKSVPHFLGSPEEIAERTDTIQIFVSNGVALESVVDQMLPKLGKKHIILNHATVGAEEVRLVAAKVEKTGASFLDAPFTGSRVAAGGGDLVYYVGGSEKVLHKIEPLLKISGSKILHVGEVGTATVLKLATNMISACTVQALSEALGLVMSQGVNPARFKEALELNGCRSPLIDMKLPAMIEEDFEPHFSLRNMSKDALYALDLGAKADLEFPALSGAAGAMAERLRENNGELDYSVLAARYLDAIKARSKEGDVTSP